MRKHFGSVVAGSLVGAAAIHLAMVACGSVASSPTDARAADAPIVALGELPAGTIVAFAGTVAPNGWLLCDGAAVGRTANASLFNVITTLYGEGDGAATFNVPDLRGRTIIGVGTGNGLTPRTIADTVGEESHTLTIAEIPSHFHGPAAGNRVLSYNASGNNGIAVGGAVKVSNDDPNAETKAIGGGQPHNNMQPSLATSYIIKL
jgi:microcystin-dependent protein